MTQKAPSNLNTEQAATPVVITGTADGSGNITPGYTGGGGGGGAVTMAAGAMATGSAVDGHDLTEGAMADTAYTDATATHTKMSFLKGLVKIWNDIWDGTTYHAVRVIGASGGTAVPISGSVTATVSGVAQDGTDPVGTGAGTQAGVATVGVGIRGWLSTLAGLFQTVGAKITQLAATMPAATTMQNAAGSGNPPGSSLPVTGYAVAIINIVSGTPMSGGTTVNFEGSVDDTTWVAMLAHQVGIVGSMVTATQVDGDYRLNVAGYKSVRARISGWSAGVTTIKGYVTPVAAHPTTVSTTTKASVGVDVTPTLTVHATYVSGDYVGTSGAAAVVAGAANYAGGGGFFSASLVDYAAQAIAGELWVFDSAITPPADSAAWSISDADLAHIVAIIPFSTYYSSALNSIAPCPQALFPFKCAAGTTSLYACFVTRGAPAYASGDLTERFVFWPD